MYPESSTMAQSRSTCECEVYPSRSSIIYATRQLSDEPTRVHLDVWWPMLGRYGVRGTLPGLKHTRQENSSLISPRFCLGVFPVLQAFLLFTRLRQLSGFTSLASDFSLMSVILGVQLIYHDHALPFEKPDPPQYAKRHLIPHAIGTDAVPDPLLGSTPARRPATASDIDV